ncbi:calmodulin-like [Cornus florida]|uniref:calmodulin-like n=1 Tax=Cornus florida TaxID=4283 RepID=UPI002897BB79|nr:calmodulin-like [Cornus florida]
MLDSCKTCFRSMHKFTRKFLQQQFNVLKGDERCEKRKPKSMFSDLNWLSSSFAAMEVSNQLKQVFKFIDANGDGKLSPLELSEVLLSLGHERSTATKEAEGMVREMDCNGDGFVDIDEFMNVVLNKGSEEGSGPGGDHHLMDAFLIFDSDKNGFISAEELQQVLIRLGCDNCDLGECRKMIGGVDKNGDGFVDFEEFRSMMTGLAS